MNKTYRDIAILIFRLFDHQYKILGWLCDLPKHYQISLPNTSYLEMFFLLYFISSLIVRTFINWKLAFLEVKNPKLEQVFCVAKYAMPFQSACLCYIL